MAENQRTCEFAGCGRPHYARGYCNGHYLQQRRGKPITALRVEMTLSERIDLHTDKTGGCWLWTGARDGNGYGQVWDDSKPRKAHRVAYELAYGPIPEGLQVDHKCHAPACVRPEHLRTCSQKQNQENRVGAQVNTKSGVRGVSWDAARRKWRAQVKHNGRQRNLGLFDTVDEAGAVARAKRLELFTHNDADRLEG